MNNDIIKKIEESRLVGRSGSRYPTGQKWKQIKETISDKKYVVCNASEGEPEIFKDRFLLDNHLDEVISGINLAIKEFNAEHAYIYLNKDYYRELKNIIENSIKDFPISLIEKGEGYIAGEETSVLETIEGRPAEPRSKPPFPTENGLWGYPTLINNVETFYWISKIDKDEYKNERFFCVSGKANKKGVFELPEDMTIKDILEKTDNMPDFDFFVQIGGGVSGVIMTSEELNQPIEGAGSIVIYDRQETDKYELMDKWIQFLLRGNCDKCTPCREGLFRISEMIDKKEIDKETLDDIFFALENTSFCPLGKMAQTPFKSLIEKII